jgi:hypothetical protein
MSARILAFPRHVLLGSALAPCDCDKREQACIVCAGGLAWCVVCSGAEGDLPTHCPGEPMCEVVRQAVYDEEIDYDARRGWYQRDTTERRTG